MAYPNTHNKVIELIKDFNKDIRIVDLGCGKREIVIELKKLGFTDVTGYDKEMDLNKKINISDNTIDLVICTEVIHYLENKFSFFREVRRILKPKGIFIFSIPNLGNIFNRTYYLFKGNFIDNSPKFINPFFIWQTPEFFSIKEVTYNRGFIPILRIPFINSRLFGQSLIVKIRINGGKE